MAQKEVIEFIAKVDDQTNQVVPTSQVNTPIPKAPVVPVDPQAGLQESINASLSKEVAEGTLDELIQSSIAREAQLRVLREINQSIKSLESAPTTPPPPGDPPTEIPTGFFDPDDNGEIPDWEKLAQDQQDAIDDLIRSFDKVDDPKIDPQRFDETTAEFDKVFEDSEKLDETIAELTESFGKPLELLGIINPELELFIKGLSAAVAGLTSVVVATQLYSSVLAATISNFGELSADVMKAQADTEVARIQQQARFAEQFGDVLADLEEGRNRQRESQRDFLAALLQEGKPWLDSMSAGFTAFLDVANTGISLLSPVLTTLKVQAAMLEQIFKVISAIANIANPFKWFASSSNDAGVGVWENLTAPENIGLDVQGLKSRNVNGRDIYAMDDLLRKNN